MTGIWFTADIHVGHAKVAELRGFPDTDSHDQALAQRWDAVIRPADQVWVLGDISGGHGFSEDKALFWISQRPGIKHLIAGNHDGVHPLHSGAHRIQPLYLRVFASVNSSAVRKVCGQRILLSHFPYRDDPHGDHTPQPRYPEYRLPDTGQYLLHGHTHSHIAVRGRQLHVGLDAHHLSPVPLAWVEKQITEQERHAHAC